MLKQLLTGVFGVVATLDFFMSTLGMAVILQATGFLSYVVCAAAALVFLSLRLSTDMIFAHKSLKLYWWLRNALCISVLLNLYATANAFFTHIVNQQPLRSPPQLEWNELFILDKAPVVTVSVVIVILMVASPIALSFFLSELSKNNDVEMEDETRFTRQTAGRRI